MTQAIGGPSYPGSPMQGQRWVPFKNNSDETIPGCAVMQVSGASEYHGQTVIDVVKPNSSGTIYIINGPSDVTASQVIGSGTFDMPATVLYNTSSGTPALGETWGPKSNQWSLEKSKSGFLVIGGVFGDGSTARMVVRDYYSKKLTSIEIDLLANSDLHDDETVSPLVFESGFYTGDFIGNTVWGGGSYGSYTTFEIPTTGLYEVAYQVNATWSYTEDIPIQAFTVFQFDDGELDWYAETAGGFASKFQFQPMPNFSSWLPVTGYRLIQIEAGRHVRLVATAFPGYRWTSQGGWLSLVLLTTDDVVAGTLG